VNHEDFMEKIVGIVGAMVFIAIAIGPYRLYVRRHMDSQGNHGDAVKEAR